MYRDNYQDKREDIMRINQGITILSIGLIGCLISQAFAPFAGFLIGFSLTRMDSYWHWGKKTKRH